jgi:hypothetical protein
MLRVRRQPGRNITADAHIPKCLHRGGKLRCVALFASPRAEPSEGTPAAGENRAVRWLPGGRPCVRLDHIEARGHQLAAEITYRHRYACMTA